MTADPTCTGAWIETFSGNKFSLLDPQPDEIDIIDIAHALSNQCRYTGHTRVFYSVAEHCEHVSRLVPAAHALAGLLHDASEAYLCDLSRPVKYLTPIGAPYFKIEDRIMRVIADKFGFEWPMPQEVKHADNVMLLTEKRQLMTDLSWSDDAASVEARTTVLASAKVELKLWTPEQAELAFMWQYKLLS